MRGTGSPRPLPDRGPLSLTTSYTEPGWGGTITVAAPADTADPRHATDRGSADLVVTSCRDDAARHPSGCSSGELLRVRLPASPTGDLTALLAEIDARLRTDRGRHDGARPPAPAERGAVGAWRAAVSDLVLLALETAARPAADGC